MAQLPIKQAVPRFQENEDRVNIFVNAPTGEDYYTTSEGENVKTLPKLVIDAEQAIQDVIDSGIGTGVIHHQMITTDGVSSTYPLTFDPIHSGNIIVNDNGIVQKQDSYSVVGTDLVFNYVPSAGVDRIEVLVFDTVPLGETDASQVSFNNADGSITTVQNAVSTALDNMVFYAPDHAEAEILATELNNGVTVWVDRDETMSGVRVRWGVFGGELVDGVADKAERVQGSHINAPTYLKTISDIMNGTPVDIMVAIPNTLKSAIRNGTSTSDVSASINAFLSDTDVPEGADIKFNEGVYSIDSEVVLSRNLNIEFSRGTIGGKGARLITRNNSRGFVCRGTPGSRMTTPRLSGIYVGSSFSGHSSDLIALEYLLSGSVDHLTANAISTGAGISFKECWDMSVVRPFIRGCGTPYNYTTPTGNERGQLHFYSPEVDNNNNIKVWHPHMEHNGGNFGAHIIIDPNASGMGNNQIAFYGIKSELNQGNSFVQNIIRGGERLDFEGSWALYDRCFRILAGSEINISGHANNNAPAAGYFASIEGGQNITGLVTGTNVGVIARNGLAARDTLRVQQGSANAGWPDLATSIESGNGIRYLGNAYRKFTNGHALESSPGTFLPSKITVTAQDFATIVSLPLSSRSYFKDGLTFFAKMSCDTGTQGVTLYSGYSGGSDTGIVTRTIGTTPAWYRFPTPPNAADKVGAFLKLVTNTMSGGKVTLHEFFITEQYESTAIPGSGEWEAGAIARNPSVASSSPVVDWVCAIGGTPGTWRARSWHVRANTTANRPVLTTNDIGVQYLDTTLAAAGKLITWNGTAWVDSTGTIV